MNKRLKILIITHNFPPLNKIGSLRTYSWAKYWSRMGHDVYVLTTKKERFDGVLNLCFNNEDQFFRIEEVSYLPFGFLNPNKSVIVGDSSPSVSCSTIDKVKSIIRDFRKYIGSLLDIHDLWIIPGIIKALKLYQAWKYEIVVSSYGPPSPHIIAGILKRILNIFWVADYRDLWYGNHLFQSKWPFSCVEKLIEDFIVSKADLITIVSDPLKKKLISRFGDKVITIENGFDQEEAENIIFRRILPNDGKIRLVYTGSIYPEKRDPSPLFEAINILRMQGIEVEKKIEVIFYGNNLGNLKDLIKRYNVENIVRTPGFVDRETSILAQKNANALIFLEWEDSSVDGILTGKLFEYMFSGRPILGIGVSSKTLPGRLIEDSRVGIALGKDSEKIAEVLKKLLNGEEISYSPSQEYLNKYTRKALAEKMLKEIMKGLCGESSNIEKGCDG